jgi:hypothetical protein
LADDACMRSITIAIPDAAAAKLTKVARQQFRAPRQQAAALLVDAIERAGLVADADGAASIPKAEPRDAGELDQ